MWRTLFVTALILCAIVFGGSTTLYITHHPLVTSVDLGEDTADAKASFRTCRLHASWPVELKPGEHLTLERRVCPVGFRKDDDDEGWPWKVQHEVLLLESRNWWHARIVAAQFSDLDFTVVDVGKTSEGRDAVVWSYFIKCGSCHGGPNGVLAWSASSNAYLWNEKWFDPFSKMVDAKLPDEDYADTPASLGWENLGTELGYGAAVYGSGDANCCPNAGHIVADLVVKDGHVTLKDGFTFLPNLYIEVPVDQAKQRIPTR
jgi:hypothetical protein